MVKSILFCVVLYVTFLADQKKFGIADEDDHEDDGDDDKPCSEFTDDHICKQYVNNRAYYCAQRWMKENCCGLCDFGHSEDEHSCRAQVDIGFIIDSQNDNYEKAFIKLVVFDFGISTDGTRAGVVTYGKKARSGIKLHDHYDLNSFNSAVDDLTVEDFNVKDMKNALRIANKDLFSLANGARPTIGKLLFVVTDGLDGRTRGIKYDADRLRRDGINIIVIGVGSIIPDEKINLDDIAGGYGKSFSVDSFYKLVTKGSIESIKHMTCEIAMGSKCHAKVDIGFILDSHEDNPQNEKHFIKAIAGSFGVNEDRTRIGAITFNNELNVSIKLNQHKDIYDFNSALREIPITGFTANKADALQLAQTELFSIANGARALTAKMLFLLTDGADKPQAGSADPGEVANNLRRIGATVIVIGVGLDTNLDKLDAIAGGPGKSFSAQSYEELQDETFLKKLSNKMCRIAQEPKCKSKLDIGFVLDSPSNSPNYTDKIKSFIKKTVLAFGISTDGSRAGIINDKGELITKFKDHSHLPDFRKAVDEISLEGSGSLLDKSLLNARKHLFSISNGARYETPNVIVVFMSDKTKISSHENVVSLTDELRMRGIKVMIVAIGELGSEIMVKMAGGKHNVFNVDSLDDLEEELFLSSLANKACQVADDVESGAIVAACSKEEIFTCYGYEPNKNIYCNSTTTPDPWFVQNCRFMCGYCNYVPDCDVSDLPSCATYFARDKDYCANHWWAKVNCPKMCGLCNILRPFNVEMMNL